MTLSSFFHSSTLKVHIPSTSDGIPILTTDSTTEEKTQWVRALERSERRDLAFYDEQLGLYLTVRVPSRSEEVGDEPSSELLTFISHLQVALETSYVSSVPQSPSVHSPAVFSFPTSNNRASNISSASLALSHQIPSSPLAHPHPNPPLSALPPNTPVPVPSVGQEDEKRYARSDGVSVWSTIWTEEMTNGKRNEVILVRGGEKEGGWVAVWQLEAPVSFMRTSIADPLFSLTASVTLREKPNLGIISGHELVRNRAPSRRKSARSGLEEETLDENELFNIDLLAGLGLSTPFPSSRLTPHLQADPSDSSSDVSSPSSSPPPSPARLLLSPTTPSYHGPRILPPKDLISLPTLKKSYRVILPLASGLNLRMRTIFLPEIVSPDFNQSRGSKVRGKNWNGEGGEGEDDSEGKRKIVMSVELEASGSTPAPSGLATAKGGGRRSGGYEIQSIEVNVGSEGRARAELFSPFPIETDKGEEELSSTTTTFPLALYPADQYNLLYVVRSSSSLVELTATPLPPPTLMSYKDQNTLPSDSTSRADQLLPGPAQIHQQKSHADSFIRPVSIVVTGRPFSFLPPSSLPTDSSISCPPDKRYPSQPFTSRWTCSLDLSHLETSADDTKRLSLSSLVASKLQNSSPSLGSSVSSSSTRSRPNSLVGGNKRFSIANMASIHQSPDALTSRLSNSSLLTSQSALPPHPTPSSFAFPALPSSSIGSNPPSHQRLPQPPTPAFPSYPSRPPVLPPSQQPLNAASPVIISTLPSNHHQRAPSTIGYIRPNAGLQTKSYSSTFGRPSSLPTEAARMRGDQEDDERTDGDGILVSVKVIPSLQVASSSPSSSDPPSPLPSTSRHPRIRPLEQFSLEVFVFNRTERVRRFTLGVPEKRRRRGEGQRDGESSERLRTMGISGPGGGIGKKGVVGMDASSIRAHLHSHLHGTSPLMALENHIRLGPLLPFTGQSVRMRFLALEEGVHGVEELELVGVGEEEFRVGLKGVGWVEVI